MISCASIFLSSLIPSAINWPPLNCWDDESDETVNNGSDMLVMASAAKSGAVLSARIVIEVLHPRAV